MKSFNEILSHRLNESHSLKPYTDEINVLVQQSITEFNQNKTNAQKKQPELDLQLLVNEFAKDPLKFSATFREPLINKIIELTVYALILTCIFVLAFFNKIDSCDITTLLAAIIGYVLGKIK